jgi:ABC-2 type transport system ATP-binding protein
MMGEKAFGVQEVTASGRASPTEASGFGAENRGFAVEARGLTKRFRGGVVAVDGLELEIERGVVYGLIGRNGAGKTTTLRLLMGLLRANAGTARVLGLDMWEAPAADRARVAYVSQDQQVPDWMTVSQLCRYAGYLYPAWNQAYAEHLIAHFGLERDRPVGRMSGGESRKAAILVALAARPEVLLLDEPAANFDPIARREFVSELASVLSEDGGCTILFSTHIISDIERIAEHVGIMDRGKLVTSARLEELQSTTKRVQVVFDAPAPPAGFTIPGAVRSEVSGPVASAVVRLAREDALDEVRRIPGARVTIFPIGLEDIFIELFGAKNARELTEGAVHGQRDDK